MKPRVFFVGTAKSGLGHLRRMASIAARMAARPGAGELVLVTNAEPAGLSAADMAAFSAIHICERREMTRCLMENGCDLAVLDTVKLPGFDQYDGPAALILRETPDTNLDAFRRAGTQPWNLLIFPNPQSEWDPELGPDFARTSLHAGWILRDTGIRGESPSSGIVVATGGGGTAETRSSLYPLLDRVLAQTRKLTARPFTLRQALGPRSQGQALVAADEIFDPGAALNDVFRRADLVISTAGYNSVLELASTDTPTLLVGIPRSLDDQGARVRRWGPRIGHGLEPGGEREAAIWLADQIAQPRRRAPVELGTNGADRAAAALLGLSCRIS